MSSNDDSLLSHANTDLPLSARLNSSQCWKPTNGDGQLEGNISNHSQLAISPRPMLSMDAGCVSSQWRSPDFSFHQTDSNHDSNPNSDDCKGDFNSTGLKPSINIDSKLLYQPNETTGIRAISKYTKAWEVEHTSETFFTLEQRRWLTPELQSTINRFGPIPCSCRIKTCARKYKLSPLPHPVLPFTLIYCFLVYRAIGIPPTPPSKPA